jgi:probable rRNA maturation factor
VIPRLDLEVTYAARRPWVPRRAQFEDWVRAALAAGQCARARRAARVEVSVRIVGAAHSRTLNARYRGKDRPTNVLSFGGAGALPDGNCALGELVICAPVVAREARSQGKSLRAHWSHMTVHGVLHLLGFDHERPAQARIMERREIQILDRLGFSDPYA